MADPYRQIPEIFNAACQDRGECERVAIIGPRLSGKTELLNSVSDALRTLAGTRVLQVRLDLAVERFADFDDPARQLARALRQNDKLRELQKACVIELPPSGTLSDVIETLLLGLRGRLILLEIDHLEASPAYMARALAEELHPLLDVGVSRDPEAAQRLGLLVCGSISLYNLLDVQNSGFIHCKPIQALSGAEEVRAAAAERLLREKCKAWDDEVVPALAHWTGGESAFARPLLEELQKKRLTHVAVRRAAKRIGGLGTRLPVLRELAMEVHRNAGLRDLVVTALEGNVAPVVPPLRPSEVTEAELSGVFVTHNDRYEFRNAMVKEFMRQLLAESKRLSPWSSNLESVPRSMASMAGDAMKLPHSVEQVARAIAAEPAIWPIISHLTELWRVLMPMYSDPSVTLLVHVEGEWYRLDSDGYRVLPLDKQAVGDLVSRVAEGARRAAERAARKPVVASNAAFFDADGGRLAVGVPLGPPARVVAVVTTVRRQVRGAAWSEPSLRNWIWFLRQNVGVNLWVRGGLEVLQHLRAVTHRVMKVEATDQDAAGAAQVPASGPPEGSNAHRSQFVSNELEHELSATSLEEFKRFHGELVVREKLERFGGRFQFWAKPMFNDTSPDELIRELKWEEHLAEWAEICKGEVADIRRAAGNLEAVASDELAKAANGIAEAAEKVTDALDRVAITDVIKAVKDLDKLLEGATDLARGNSDKLRQIIEKARREPKGLTPPT